MGALLSQIRTTLATFSSLASAYSKLGKRIESSPGIPVPNPSTPYWAIPPSSIAKHTHEEFPEYADVVIIGSGITGTSFARELLDGYYGGKKKVSDSDSDKKPIKVVMLEARDACSGATARNGGHVRPVSYPEYPAWKKKYGVEEARGVVRFRRSHVEEMLRVAEEEDLLGDSQARRVQTYDVFYEKALFEDMKGRLEVYLEDISEEKGEWAVLEDRESIRNLQLADRVAGIISTAAGVLHPYRLVTGILERLLKTYPESFFLFTNTPCTTVSAPFLNSNYIVRTPKGSIQTRHVIHATNGWASHLLEPMRSKIIPLRGVMTAQRPGTDLGHISATQPTKESWLGQRSFLFFPGSEELQFDYLSQMPVSTPASSPSKYPTPSGELMYGGGFFHNGISEFNLTDIGNVDDTDWDHGVEAYLAGALASGLDGGWFGRHWGEEGRPSGDVTQFNGYNEEFGKGRVIKAWSGIMGYSADRMPWVGRLPPKTAGREGPKYPSKAGAAEETAASSLATSGEWIAAGFSGEGMVQAWMCGKALAGMVLGKDAGEDPAIPLLPDCLIITEKRWRRARPEDAI
ncbi:hypothetical protein VKT23_002880 [Stygiomarasmius scandens]|uniref:FAD dependent oxidoreductase domain-containing protein n=1 Tax=Marasmiellus scandens TaxID=2682957 RepID=A0ABR1K177_9AGAR